LDQATGIERAILSLRNVVQANVILQTSSGSAGNNTGGIAAPDFTALVFREIK
jgi:hypothetical protein